MQEDASVALKSVADAVSDAAAAYINLAKRIDSAVWTNQLLTLAEARHGLRQQLDVLLVEVTLERPDSEGSAPYMVHAGGDALSMIENFEQTISQRIALVLDMRLPQPVRSRLLALVRELDASLAATRTLRLEAAE